MVPDFHLVSVICTVIVSVRANRALVTCKYYLHQESYTNRNIHAAMLKFDQGNNIKTKSL